MDINCEKIVEKYLLIQNPLYAFSFPISILVAIIVFGIAKAYKWSNNSYVNQILIPIVALLVSMVLLDLISRMMISREDKIKLSHLCKIWMHDPVVKGNRKMIQNMDMNMIANYRVENFTADVPNKVVNTSRPEVSRELTRQIKSNIDNNNVEPVIDEIPRVSPFPLENKPNGMMCIQNSNGCNLCSGSGQNPDNIVAPIPGPQWMPQSAESVQNRLMNNMYTPSTCPIK